jgi:hypothetical protein
MCAIIGIKVPGRCFAAQMPRGAFSHTRGLRDYLAGIVSARARDDGLRRTWQRRSDIMTLLIWQRICFLLRSDQRGNTFSQHCRSRNKKAPAPGETPGKFEHHRKGSDDESHPHENVHDPFLEAGWSVIPVAFIAPPLLARTKGCRRFGQLSGEGLRHETDIGATRATKTCSINILSCARWTKHFASD